MHDDLVDRDFTATPDRMKMADRYHRAPHREGKLYVCAVKDCYSGRIVGYSIDTRMKAPRSHAL